MIEGLVTFLLTKLAGFIQEEERLLTGVKEEAEYIGYELQFMLVFLRAADAMEEHDDGLKVLVQSVRDVAYDMEDILDLFRLRLTRDHGDKFCSSVSNNLQLHHHFKSSAIKLLQKFKHSKAEL
ncbi:hypothetical protein OIU77_023279 [Salix suchowensis]|uniref:Disease resistance N-terminal domain-containing protein n=1 Tax=Salix suchowensis TaxID=1278906 RepID=A0ABQ9C6Y9_9ROSI|nr:hypothetical protein OIU77_023279 [Salix suchowensis]